MSDEKRTLGRSSDEVARALASMSSGQTSNEPDGLAQAPPPATGAVDNLSEPVAGTGDDAVIAPAPDPSVLMRKRPAAVPAQDHGLELRRTLIPILLTLGVLLPVLASLKWMGGAESPFAAIPTGLSIALFVLGACFLGVAALNMMQVKRRLHS